MFYVRRRDIPVGMAPVYGLDGKEFGSQQG